MILKEQLLEETNEILKQKSFPVTFPLSEKTYTAINDMVEYLRISIDDEKNKDFDYRPAIGISACQFGYLKNMFAIKLDVVENDEIIDFELALINPKIIERKGKAYLTKGEGCLNVDRNVDGYVLRSDIILIEGFDWIRKKQVKFEAKGLLSIAIQHEYDHLLGILFVDKLISIEDIKKHNDVVEVNSRSEIKWL